MPHRRVKYTTISLMVEEIMREYMLHLCLCIHMLVIGLRKKRKRSSTSCSYSMIDRIPSQVHHLHRMVRCSDIDCISNLRMDRNTFGRLCLLLKQLGGLNEGKYVSVEEQVAVFLGILAHHKKNKIVKFNFLRSGQTISSCVRVVLKAILKLHTLFLVKPTPVQEDCDDPRWKCFKGCLGALDGTYINLTVRNHDKPRYRNRKGHICTNTLAVCDQKLRFVYVLPGWEGSAADGRVLRDAVNRQNGLKVPRGTYYLCDNGYANSEGLLTPYKGVRYHLKEWGPEAQLPQNPVELFNMRHTRARNVIERAFGIMKMRWGILRSASYYPVKTQIRLLMACFLLHNFIRSEMKDDPIEQIINEYEDGGEDATPQDDEDFVDFMSQHQFGTKKETNWHMKCGKTMADFINVLHVFRILVYITNFYCFFHVYLDIVVVVPSDFEFPPCD